MSEIHHGPHLPRPTPLGDAPAVPPDRPVPPPPPPRPINLATDDVPCKNCGFNLRGLSEDGNCPECGASIWRSLQGNLLDYSSPAYVRSLHRGLNCILIAALLNIAMAVVGMAIGIALAIAISSGAGGNAGGANTLATNNMLNAMLQLVSLPIAFLSLFGWWLFSAPDPGQHVDDTGQTPRRIVRAAVITLAVFNVIATIAQFLVMAVPSISLAVGLFGLVAMAAVIAQFFAAMLYLRWMGSRIPDAVVVERSKLYMWLLPVIFVVGICALGLGPLIAWIMYLMLLNRVRIDLRDLRHQISRSAAAQPVNAFAPPTQL